MLRSLTVPLLCGCLAAQTSPDPLADLLPTSTYAVARFAGLDACRTAANDSPLAALVHGFLARVPAEVRAERFERGLDRAGDEAQRALQRAGLSPIDVRAVLQQPMLLAVGRLTVEGMGPSLCLVVQQGDHAPAFERCRAALRQVVSRRAPYTAWTAARIGDVDVECLQLPGGPPVLFAELDGHLAITNSRGYLGELVAVARGQAPSLGARLRAEGDALASVFVDAGSLFAVLQPHLPYEAAAFADALGVGMPGALQVSVHGGADRLRLELGGSARGLAKVLHAAPARLDFASACSPNTVLFGAGSVDVAGLLTAWDAFVALLPPDARRELQRAAARGPGRALRRLGATPAELERLAAALRPQVQLALALEPAAVPKPELLLHVGVREREPVAAALRRLEAATTERGLAWRARQVGDLELRYCNVRLDGDGPQLSPCYVLRDDGLWCASDVRALMRALQQAEAPEQSLAAEPDFAELAQAARGRSGVLHVRSFRAVELGWRTVETWLHPQVDAHRDELGFGSEALPDRDETARAFGTCSCVYTIDDSGVEVECRGPFTFGALLAAAAALADDVLARAGARVF